MSCECYEAGWCERYQRHMAPVEMQLCASSPRYRALFEKLRDNGHIEQKVDKPIIPSEVVAIESPQGGLGDLVAKAARNVGIKPCGGCKRRKRRFNKAVPKIAKAIEKWTAGLISLPSIEPDRDYSFQWAVGVTTAPRKTPSIAKSLTSLQNAGWDLQNEVTIFAEPGSVEVENVPTHWQTDKAGSWRNWHHALRQLIAQYPEANAYMLCQDDVLYCKGLREYLENDLWPDEPEKVGFVTPYCSSRHGPRGKGTVHKFSDDFLWGALCYIFPPSSAYELLSDEPIHEPRGNKIDVRVSRWCARTKRGQWFYRPSLAQHIIGPSTLNHGSSGRGGMSANTFVGENFDVTERLEVVAS